MPHLRRCPALQQTWARSNRAPATSRHSCRPRQNCLRHMANQELANHCECQRSLPRTKNATDASQSNRFASLGSTHHATRCMRRKCWRFACHHRLATHRSRQLLVAHRAASCHNTNAATDQLVVESQSCDHLACLWQLRDHCGQASNRATLNIQR